MFVLVFARPSCLTIPQFPEPQKVAPLLRIIKPDPYYVNQLTEVPGERILPKIPIDVELFSEDLDDTVLSAQAFLDYPKRPWVLVQQWDDIPAAHLSVDPDAGRLTGRPLSLTVDLSAAHVTPGCHSLTLIVKQPGGTTRQATATWWLDVNDQGDQLMAACPGVDLVGADAGTAP